MTFRDVLGGGPAEGVPWHPHDASDISGEIIASTMRVEHLIGGTIDTTEINVASIITLGTGGIFRTAESGQRIELTNLAGDQIDFYSGHGSETSPGKVEVNSAGFTIQTPTITGVLPDAGSIIWTATDMEFTHGKDDAASIYTFTKNSGDFAATVLIESATAASGQVAFGTTSGSIISGDVNGMVLIAGSGASSIDFNVGGVVATIDSDRVTIDKFLNLGPATELTIASGSITVTGSYHRVDTQDDDATDDLSLINGGTEGDVLILRAADDARTVVLKDSTNNLQLAGGDFSLTHRQDSIMLMFWASNWNEISRSNNTP